MRRLGGTDALFLSMETPAWHQHIAGLTVLEPGDRPVTFEAVRDQIARRLVYAPKFTWKLREVPLGIDRPVWIDDPDFDVRRHVRRIAVPSPGGAKELGELAGTLASTQLDRRRPLWEVWYIEGLAGGRVGVLMKYHHCLLDGMAGASLATVLLDLEPDATEPLLPPPSEEERTAGPDPSDLRLLAETLRPDVRRPLQLARFVTGLAAKGVALVD
ncbi:MAG TPA: wax ester/triacylglycerol synthase domain-containing protein, partial [Acidimicrobiales bacterium]|nr:wax ester/triacylglycerol synthase domain-containing protein [Acidimicrobiales bacterium]